MSDLCVFTANADELLIASGKRVGIAVQSYDVNPWRGYVDGKLRRGIAFLEARKEPFAMWLDGFDTLLIKSEADILQTLEDMRYAFVMAAERTCWPDAHLADQFPLHDGPRFPQAGGFIGLRGDVLESMTIALECATDDDDQRAWTTAILSGKLPDLVLDHERRIFCSVGDGDSDGLTSCSVHHNGRVGGREDVWRYISA